MMKKLIESIKKVWRCSPFLNMVLAMIEAKEHKQVS